jgi:stringent starvation protein B
MNPPAPGSRRPYLLRAMREWMLDNGLTPHIIVDATAEGVVVPSGSVRDGKIVLNLAPAAVDALHLGNDVVRFRARFGGAVRDVHVPVHAVLGIYARESGQGLLFADDDDVAPGPRPPDDDPGPPARPRLRVIK